MQIAYDFHIHTAASPCAEEEMTPSNIIQLAKLLNKQMIAITDHNTCVNCEVMMQVGRAHQVMVFPGMEVECREEFHVLTLFPTLEAAYKIQEVVWENLPPLLNRKEIFGSQYIFNTRSEVIGELPQLLLTATNLTIQEVVAKVDAVGGITIPAHIDRSSYSILSNLGAIPEDLNFRALEVSNEAALLKYGQYYPQYTMLKGSDAHCLERLCEVYQYLEIEEQSWRGLQKMLGYFL